MTINARDAVCLEELIQHLTYIDQITRSAKGRALTTHEMQQIQNRKYLAKLNLIELFSYMGDDPLNPLT